MKKIKNRVYYICDNCKKNFCIDKEGVITTEYLRICSEKCLIEHEILYLKSLKEVTEDLALYFFRKYRDAQSIDYIVECSIKYGLEIGVKAANIQRERSSRRRFWL